ncbi:O-antigen ligase family protein [Gluconacetobacter entanii]|uniref:O-antigen ligase family protein n=1 Tax=Gluconacetobacter entanii TaxID=108528 RepID=A0ABT3K881_9PROT|nr:O-antigen ligase family protein [Gluconacetobacter entanii]MCW4591633.1 O-antigen ligase family protein [Gluconacetobacter entanii]MCW4595323.1 O-antigen ligase family protein [Gluconacetobacter entanii]
MPDSARASCPPDLSWMKRPVVWGTYAFPLLLCYALAPAEILLCLIAGAFVIHSALSRDWSWLRQPWFVLSLLLGADIVLASACTGSMRAVVQSVLLLRYPVFVAAMAFWVLTDARDRHRLATAYAWVAIWMVAGSWQQYLWGRNIMGYGRWEDGALLGPLWAPRAGQALFMTAFPGLMPVIISLAQRRTRGGLLCAGGLLVLLVLTFLLISQRMPTLLFLFGTLCVALMVRSLRLPFVLACMIGAGGIALSPVVAPQAYNKLVISFEHQMHGFADSPYGMLFIRAGVMVSDHPLVGMGYDGFRINCPNPIYFRGLPALGIADGPHGGAPGCNLHPHNYYIQVATMAGVPGMVLFCLLVIALLRPMARGLRAHMGVEQMVMCVLAFVIVWPLQSTSSFSTQPTAGWVFIALGWALAATRGGAGTERAGQGT